MSIVFSAIARLWLPFACILITFLIGVGFYWLWSYIGRKAVDQTIETTRYNMEWLESIFPETKNMSDADREAILAIARSELEEGRKEE